MSISSVKNPSSPRGTSVSVRSPVGAAVASATSYVTGLEFEPGDSEELSDRFGHPLELLKSLSCKPFASFSVTPVTTVPVSQARQTLRLEISLETPVFLRLWECRAEWAKCRQRSQLCRMSPRKRSQRGLFQGRQYGANRPEESIVTPVIIVRIARAARRSIARAGRPDAARKPTPGAEHTVSRRAQRGPTATS